MSREWRFISTNTEKRPVKSYLSYPRGLMSQFKVGSKISQVEVYVHNYQEYFLRTVERMRIAEQAQASVNAVGSNLEQRVKKYKTIIKEVEDQYIRLAGFKNKKEYRAAFINKTENLNDEVSVLVNDYVNLSPDNLKSLQAYIERGTGKQLSRKEALAEISKRLPTLVQGMGEVMSLVAAEQQKIQKNDFTETNAEALKRRRQEKQKISAKIAKEDLVNKLGSARTLKEYRPLMTDLRFQHLGIMFEPLAGIFLANFHNKTQEGFETMTNKKISNVTMQLTGDMGTDKVGVTDLVLKIGDMVVGVDVKSSAKLYTKSTQRSGYGYELTSEILLGKGGMTKFFGNLGGQDPELMKKLAYILVNMSIFEKVEGLKDPGKKTEAYKAMRSIVMMGALVDFMKSYIEKFDNMYRKQILIMAGNQVYFLTELIDMLVYMIQKIKSTSSSNYGGFAYLASKKDESVNVGEHKNLLAKKREVMKNNPIKYEILFNRLGRNEMKKFVGPALRRTMQVRLALPLSATFSKI